jgi:hypothetical protein
MEAYGWSVTITAYIAKPNSMAKELHWKVVLRETMDVPLLKKLSVQIGGQSLKPPAI